MKKIIIAIDGESSSGKSTLAKALAQKLSFTHINTGSMYRAVTLFALNKNIISKEESIVRMMSKLHFEFKLINGNSNLFLNGLNVENKIRLSKVSDFVSQVSTIPELRKKIVQIQRKLGSKKGIVMEGRDIGSIVFPNAELKLFITANIEERVNRRFNELRANNINITKHDVLENLNKRDFLDKNRHSSPLIQVEDAMLIDNTELSVIQQIDIIINYLKKNL